MKKILLAIASISFSGEAHAACPPAPVGVPNDPVLQLKTNGDGQAGLGPANRLDATEEGALVWDNTNNTLSFCDGTNWQVVVVGSDLRTDCDISSNLEWDGVEWQCTIPLPAPPTGCPSIGDVCSDGSVYAGVTPEDGITDMYTTSTRSSSQFRWDSGSSGLTGMELCDDFDETSCRTGETNTSYLVGISGSYEAANYCSGLTAHGKSDWYLPSYDELNQLRSNQAAIGGFPYSDFDSRYWSSSERALNMANIQYINSGSGGSGALALNSTEWVRCVRK